MNPIQNVRAGMEGSELVVVTRELTVAHFRAGMPEVYGTPFMIYLMEVAAANAIQSALPEGWVSVGVEVNVRHLAATPVGRTVTATARVISLNDRLVTFNVLADDGAERIGTGTHVRAAVNVEKFERRMQGKQAM